MCLSVKEYMLEKKEEKGECIPLTYLNYSFFFFKKNVPSYNFYC